MKKRDTRNNEGIGNLDNAPYFFTTYSCCKCKKEFSFLSGYRCTCEKAHKFRAKPCIVNEIRFDGIVEARRYSKLYFLEQNKIISDLKTHPVFKLDVNEKPIGKYEADFEYEWNGKKWVEDVKGKLTDVFKLKMKLMGAIHPEVNLILTF